MLLFKIEGLGTGFNMLSVPYYQVTPHREGCAVTTTYLLSGKESINILHSIEICSVQWILAGKYLKRGKETNTINTPLLISLTLHSIYYFWLLQHPLLIVSLHCSNKWAQRAVRPLPRRQSSHIPMDISLGKHQ